MHRHLISAKKAKALCGALFLVGLAILSYTGAWWPGIMLAIGIPLALRQLFLGRAYDMLITLLVFTGVFVIVQFDLEQRLLLPVIFIVAAIYLFFSEYTQSASATEDEREEDLNEEIEEDQHQDK